MNIVFQSAVIFPQGKENGLLAYCVIDHKAFARGQITRNEALTQSEEWISWITSKHMEDTWSYWDTAKKRMKSRLGECRLDHTRRSLQSWAIMNAFLIINTPPEKGWLMLRCKLMCSSVVDSWQWRLKLLSFMMRLLSPKILVWRYLLR